MSAIAPAQDASPSPAPKQTTISRCAGGVNSPSFDAYDLGQDFGGLRLTNTLQDCSPTAAPTWNGHAYVESPATVRNVTLIYGSCETPANALEGGCSPPLEVQVWPECARKLSLYTQTGSDGHEHPLPHVMLSLPELVSGVLPRLPQLVPDLPTLIPQLVEAVPQLQQAVGQVIPQLAQTVDDALPTLTSELSGIPVASFEGGTQVELYTGKTTIVVFANDAAMAKTAASVLGLKAALRPGAIAAGDLKAKATSSSQCV